MNPRARAVSGELIRASAGSGKTFQLTNRLIRALDEGVPPECILATTFTRKAAGEIFQRVLVRLARAALDDDRARELAGHVGRPALTPPRALAHLASLTRQLERFRVSTLDSFFMHWASAFSLELGLPPGWSIADDLLTRRLVGQAIREVLRHGGSELPTLVHLLFQGEARHAIHELIEAHVLELHELYLEAPAEAWQCVPRPKRAEAAALEAALAALEAVPLPDSAHWTKARQRSLTAVRDENWTEFLGKGIPPKIIAGETVFQHHEISDEVRRVLQPLIEHAQACVLCDLADQTEAAFRLLRAFDEQHARLLAAHRVLRFQDVTRTLAGGRGPAEEGLAWRLDGAIRHLLLDEFQDTAPLQWRVLEPLAHQVRGTGRTFFCVGDAKQAIYGWRGGEAEIFTEVESQLGPLRAIELNQSFRSAQAVIDTVNRVFGDLAANPALARYPRAAAQWAGRFQTHTTAKTALAGYCTLKAAAVDPADGEPETPADGPRTDPAEEAALDQNQAILLETAGDVEAIYRQTEQHTIGVLVRTNRLVAQMIYQLHRRGIPASEEGGNPLTDSPAVTPVLSLLTLADHPGDRVARFHVAHGPLGEALGYRDWNDPAATARLARQVRRHLADDGYGPTIEDWVNRLSGACGPRDRRRLSQLVLLAYSAPAHLLARPDDFVELVRQRRIEDPSSARVRVMTIHQAKGLEFDVVVFPAVGFALRPPPPTVVAARPRPAAPVDRIVRYCNSKRQAVLPEPLQALFARHVEREISESLSMLYVALTRAVHALHIVVPPSAAREKGIPSTAAGLLRAALSGTGPAAAGALLYEHGSPDWFAIERTAARRPRAGASARAKSPPPTAFPTEVPKRQAQPLPAVAPRPARPARPIVFLPGRRPRLLPRQSPSELEGGSEVQLARRMRLAAGAALGRGSLFHAWFETIEWLDAAPRSSSPTVPDDAALARIARQYLPAQEDFAPWIARFRAMLEQEAIARWLSRKAYLPPPGGPARAIAARTVAPLWGARRAAESDLAVWRERRFAVKLEQAILSGTFDRVVVLHEGGRAVAADVLDFKTDAVAADDPAALAAAVEFYRPQVTAYRSAVAQLCGLAPRAVSARLLFVEAAVMCTV